MVWQPKFQPRVCDLTTLEFCIPILILLHTRYFFYLCLSWPLCFPFHPLSPSISLYLCSTESDSDRPSPTGLCWRPTLRRWFVSLSLFLSPVTSADTMTGRDSHMTSQFPPRLRDFTSGLQKDFQLTWLYTYTKKILIPKVDQELRIWTCLCLLHKRWQRPLVTTAFCLTSTLINMV